MKHHAPERYRSLLPKAFTPRTLASLAVAVLLLSPGVPPTRGGVRPATTYVRPVSFAQSSDAATLPAGLALDACGVPFIADIEKFLDTCPASDPASAKVFLDAVKHKKTSNDELNPATVLIARKAGKEIAPGQTVTVQVRNPDGLLSNELTYTRSVE